MCVKEKEYHKWIGNINNIFLCLFLHTCPPWVLIIWLGFNVGFEFILLIAHIHPPVPHYLLLGASHRTDATRQELSKQ